MAAALEEFAVLRPAALEMEGRPYRVKKLELIDYRPERSADTLLVSPGCIGIFIGPKGSALLAEVREAATGGKESGGFADRLRSQLADRPGMPVADAVDLLLKQPVFGSVRYGGRTVVSSVFPAPGAPLAAIALPYNGGQLAPGAFSLVEHYLEGRTEELDGIAIRHSPQLTAAEKAALDKLPPEMAELNVGTAVFCFALSVIAIAAAVSLATGICCPQRGVSLPSDTTSSTPVPNVHITDVQLSNMSAALAARELLRIRREILERT